MSTRVLGFSDEELAGLRKLYGGKDVIVWVYTKPSDSRPRLWAIPSHILPAQTYRDDRSYKLAGALSLLTGRVSPTAPVDGQDEASAGASEASSGRGARAAVAVAVFLYKTLKFAVKLWLLAIATMFALVELACGGRR